MPALRYKCSSCGTEYDLDESHFGRRLQCDVCNAALAVSEPKAAAQTVPSVESPSAEPQEAGVVVRAGGDMEVSKGARPILASGPKPIDGQPSPPDAGLPHLGICKDPLHLELTPYEVLGVACGADKATIERALIKAIRSRVPQHTAQAARNALLKPVERAAYDVLLYDRTVLARLTPNPLQDLNALQPSRRLATARSWEQQLRASFPDPAIAHCLAVLWYWWAQHAQEQLDALLQAGSAAAREEVRPQLGLSKEAAGKQESSAPPLEDIWQRVIIYWSMLSASPEPWNGRLGLSESEVSIVRKRFTDSLTNRLIDLAQRYDQQRDLDHNLPISYRQLHLHLTSELKTAEAMAKSGYRTKRGRVTAGVLMLQHLGLLSKVRDQVDGLLQKTPGNKELRQLRALLSPHFPIIILLDENKPEQALQQIEQLQAAARDTDEVHQLRGRALLLLGRQKASVNQIEEALEQWGLALGESLAADLREEIREEVVSACQSQAQCLEKRDPDRAKAILEKGLLLTENAKLKLRLAEMLVSGSIDVFNQAQNDLRERRGSAQAAIAAMEKAKVDIARAVGLGSKRAAENLKTAEDVLEDLKQQFANGLLDLPQEAEASLRKANDAIGHDDWDTAVDQLRQALNQAGGNRLGLKKRLAFALANRGIGNANRAVESISAAAKAHHDLMAGLTDRIKGHVGIGDCALCSRTKFNTYGQDWYTVTLSGGTSAQLCGGCMQQLRSLEKQAPKPDRQALILLRSGERDLAEAVSIDPSNEHAQKNLRAVRETLSNVPADILPPLAPSKPIRRDDGTVGRAQTSTPARSSPIPANAAAKTKTEGKAAKFLKATWWLWGLALIWLVSKGCQ